MPPVKVKVEYSGGFRCAPQFEEMQAEVTKQFEGSDVIFEGVEGRNSSFEITINGVLIYSKLDQCGFPYKEDVVESIRAAQKGEELKTLTRTHAGPCNII